MIRRPPSSPPFPNTPLSRPPDGQGHVSFVPCHDEQGSRQPDRHTHELADAQDSERCPRGRELGAVEGQKEPPAESDEPNGDRKRREQRYPGYFRKHLLQPLDLPSRVEPCRGGSEDRANDNLQSCDEFRSL